MLAECDGIEVHRSHWVATSQVRGLRREGRNLRLRMSNGLEVPVSRAFQAQVRQTFGERAVYGASAAVGEQASPR